MGLDLMFYHVYNRVHVIQQMNTFYKVPNVNMISFKTLTSMSLCGQQSMKREFFTNQTAY